MTDDMPELLAFLEQEEARARDTTLDDQRAALLSFYNGEPYGDEEEGRSQLVTRDVAEVVDHMTVSVLRTMVSGDKVVEFEDSDHDSDEDETEEGVEPQAPQMGPDGQPMPPQPQGPRPPSMSEQATEAVGYYFMKKSRGYTVLHDSLKAGLLEKTGWIKVYPEPQAPKRKQLQVPAELLGMVDAKEAEPVDPANEAGMWNVTVHEPQPVKFCAVAVPNEEVHISPDARSVREAIYLAHEPPMTLSGLAEMGFDTSEISAFDDNHWLDYGLHSARDSDRTWDERSVGNRTGANRRCNYKEEYVRFDLNGDGISELVCVHRVGKHILVDKATGQLAISEVEENPFEAWCPFPMQHRLVGQSLADKVADIQRTNSVLLRNGMDSLYIGLAPRTFVHENSIGENTVDDLLTVRPNAIVRWTGAVKPETVVNQDTSGTAFQAIEFMIGQRESRTGITRMNQGLNQDTLNKTATGTAMMQAAGQQIEEYVARNFAELVVAPVFAKMYRQMRAYGTPFKMRIDGQLVMIDPRKWPEEVDINVRVGLGSGRKEQRLMYRMQLLSIQQQALMGGLPIVTPEHIFNNVRGLIEDSNLGNPTDYVADPATMPPMQPPPNPEVIKAQTQAQLDAAKQQHDQQMAEAAHQIKAMHAEADVQIKGAKAQQDAELAHQSASFQADLANRKFAAEMELNQQKLNAQIMLDQQMHEHSMALAQMKVSQDRPGGSLDA